MYKLRRTLLILLSGLFLFQTALAQDADNLLPTVPGRIAFIGDDQNVYLLDLGEGQPIALTADGSRTRVYQWPTWATDGRLAYFLMNFSSDRFATEVYISPDASTPGQAVYTGDSEFFNYAYWSPQNCQDTPRCRDLAVLLSSEAAGGLFVQLIRDGLEETLNRRIGTGGPFYFSWSPDGSRMLWQRNTERLDIYDAEAGLLMERLPLTPGMFQAPSWSPIDDRLLVGTLNPDRDTTDLVISANDELRVLAAQLEGVVAFAWSPDGDYVAYVSRQGPLLVLNAYTGDIIARSPTTGVFAFFWSPNSQHIAYITLSSPPSTFSVDAAQGGKTAAYQQNLPGIAWTVLDVATGATRRYGAFIPTQDMLYLLTYFDQFAQSHRLWSPDSRYLIYAERTPIGEGIISLLDTTQANTVPFSIANGLIGIWSFN